MMPARGSIVLTCVWFAVACSPGHLQDGSHVGGSGGTSAAGGGTAGGGTAGDCGDYCDCGNATVESPEECDDGKTQPDDGCSPQCSIESGWTCDGKSPSRCEQIPSAPTIDGEISAGHPNPSWLWNLPAHATLFRYRLDEGAYTDTTAQRFSASALANGPHQFDVMACNSLGGCSPASSFHTTIEKLGPGYGGHWDGVAKPNLTTTPLGNVVPVSCHNCYNGADDEPLDLQQARFKIALALDRDADIVDLDVAATANGTLCATYDDVETCTARLPLQDLMDTGNLRAADALLFVEIREVDMAPGDFADRLLALLDQNREYVRNGRPVVIHAFDNFIKYLEAVQTELPAYPLIAPYVKFAVLYGLSEARTTADLQTAIATDAIAHGFEMVAFDYRIKNLFGAVRFAQDNGLAAGVFVVPAYFGEPLSASLREDFDFMSSEFRVDLARVLLEEATTLAHLDSWKCESDQDPHVTILRNTDGTLSFDQVAVNVAPTASSFGAPALVYDGAGNSRYGCSLDFRSSQSLFNRAIDLGVLETDAGEGFLISALVNFSNLNDLAETTRILGSSSGTGFTLELVPGAGENGAHVRAGFHIDGGYRYQSYDVTATGIPLKEALSETDSYLLTAAYDGDGGLFLWIDSERTGNGGYHSGGVMPSQQSTLAGATPCSQCAIDAEGFFDGLIQKVSVLSWDAIPYDGPNWN